MPQFFKSFQYKGQRTHSLTNGINCCVDDPELYPMRFCIRMSNTNSMLYSRPEPGQDASRNIVEINSDNFVDLQMSKICVFFWNLVEPVQKLFDTFKTLFDVDFFVLR
jgi:hypothetical protein